MPLEYINRSCSFSELSSKHRYIIIMTPVNKIRRGVLKHLALIDSAEKEIIEGLNSSGVLEGKLKQYYEYTTVEKYVESREKIIGFRFSDKEDILIHYYPGIPSFAPYDKELRDRWDEMHGVKKTYHNNGKTGWNCESLVYYILSGYPIAPQGEWHARNFWDLRDADAFSQGAFGFWDRISSFRLDETIFPYVEKFNNRKKPHWNY